MVNRNIRIFVARIVRYTKILLLLVDILVLNFSFFLALLIRFGSFNSPYMNEYMRVLLLGNILWILLIGVFDAYKVMRFELVEKALRRVVRMVLTHFPLFILMTYILDFRDSSRLVFFVFFLFMLSGVLVYRIVLFEFLKYMRRRGVNHKVVAIVGYNNNAKDIYEVLTSDIAYGYRVMGFFTDEQVDPKEVRYIGNLDSIENELKKGRIEEMYVALATTNSRRVKGIFKICDRLGVRVKIIPDFQKYTSSHHVQIRYYSHVPVLQMRTEPLAYFANKAVKRIFDIIFSLLVLFGLFVWIFPIVALITKLTSKGPVIFRQKRSGIDGKVFTCYKIRTMVVDGEFNEDGTVKNDPRVTAFGKFLRRSKIDELPQFINVLIGTMSVVGPRPHMLVHTDKYSELINEFSVRHFVKPGITGLAQTVGYIDASHKLKEMQDKVKNDIWYIENWSFLLDLKIIINTTFAIFRKEE